MSIPFFGITLGGMNLEIRSRYYRQLIYLFLIWVIIGAAYLDALLNHVVNNKVLLLLTLLSLFVTSFFAARLQSTIIHIHEEKLFRKNNKNTQKQQESKYTSITECCRELQLYDFTLRRISSLNSEENVNIVYLERILHKKGTVLEQIIAMEGVQEPELFYQLAEEAVTTALRAAEKHRHLLIRRRFVILCLFGSSYQEDFIKYFLSQFYYLFSFCLPILVDIQSGRLYHAEIPFKNKRYLELQEFVSEHFYR